MRKTAGQKKEKDGGGGGGGSSPKGVKLRPCAVCEADSTGYHFGVMSCEACKSFFRRSLKRRADMICAKDSNCNIKYGEVKGTPCPACRVNRCIAVGMSLNAVKKGRYTLERRAETIKESKRYWTSVSDNHESPPANNPALSTVSESHFPFKSEVSFPAQSSQQHQTTTSNSLKRQSLSFSSNSSSFDSDPGLRLQDDGSLLGGGGEAMLGFLGDTDSGLLQTADPDLNTLNIQQGHHASTSDMFLPHSGYADTANRSIKALLTAPHSPVLVPNSEHNISDSPFTDVNSPLSSFSHDSFGETTPGFVGSVSSNGLSSTSASVSLCNPAEQSNNIHVTQSMDSIINAQLSENAEIGGLFTNGGKLPASLDVNHDPQSESTIEKLLDLKALFKDPTNLREFKTDYLKGFKTEKQDCDSIETLFKSVQRPADALDIALADANSGDENLDKLIDQTIEAFDKQNFLTRGFLAKMPDYQHRFLLEREEKERLFGPMKPLSFQEHKQIFDETGIDVDGRQALLQHFADSVMVPHFRKVAAYITSLPGVRTLPPEDQYNVLKYTKAEMKVAALFPVFNVSHKLYTISEGQVGITLGYDELLIYHSKEVIDGGYEIAGKLQDMELTDQEYAMVVAVCIIKPEVCVTDEGKEKCSTIRSRMFSALERLLCRRVSSSDAQRVLGEVRGFIHMFRDKHVKFNEEWDDMFKQNQHIHWPRFIWDLLVTPVECTP